jgi:ubiquitin C-terminal hydrolase
MGKIKKSFKQYSEENEEVRKRPLKKESRHNYKTHLMDVIENEDWDELEDELNEQGRVHRR